ncbi:NUDIX hydrolase [Chloroflexi bacterium TSY]|nr:NUDIX hydrolase [Chloroflexi bacterium TSY]
MWHLLKIQLSSKEYTGEIVPYGCVTRGLAHSTAKIPHATVQIIPIRYNTRNVFIHKRSEVVRTSPGLWDIFGGHISFEMWMLSSPLAEASLITAIREAQEEILITVDGKPHIFQESDFRQIGQVGQFQCREERNVEYSTAFVVCINPDKDFKESPFERKQEGQTEWLEVEEIEWHELLKAYKSDLYKNVGFADGISRILKEAIDESSEVYQQIETAIDQYNRNNRLSSVETHA